MYSNITCDYDNYNSHLSKKPLKISFNFKFGDNSSLKDYDYIYCIKIEIKDIITKTFYSYFTNEFMKIMVFKNDLHSKITSNKGIHTSHIINNGIIHFFYLLKKENLKDVILETEEKFFCFDINFQLIKNIDNKLDNFLETY